MVLKKNKDSRGFALVYVLMMILIFNIIIAWVNQSVNNTLKDSKKEFRKSGQAMNQARSGAEAAFFWFSRQLNQPLNTGSMRNYYTNSNKKFKNPETGIDATGSVAIDDFFSYPDSAFFPTYDIDPNKSDTDDENFGLVKDVVIDKATNLYGRYEVKRQSQNNDPLISISGSFGSLSKNDPDAVHDVSNIKSANGANKGIIWRITSKGYVYVRNNMDKDTNGEFTCTYDNKRRTVDRSDPVNPVITYTPDPLCNNSLLDQNRLSIDIQKISIDKTRISQAPVVITDATNIYLEDRTRITGGNIAEAVYALNDSIPTSANLKYMSGLSNPPILKDSVFKLTATPNLPALEISTLKLLSVNERELKGIADQSVENVTGLARSDSRKSLGAAQIIYISPINKTLNDVGNADSSSNYEVVFDNANPLRGGGIVFIDGDARLTNDSYSVFSGILYVKGSLRIEAENQISGTIIMGSPNSKLRLVGNGGQAIVEYSPQVIDNVLQRVSKYRKNSLSYKTYDLNK